MVEVGLYNYFFVLIDDFSIFDVLIDYGLVIVEIEVMRISVRNNFCICFVNVVVFIVLLYYCLFFIEGVYFGKFISNDQFFGSI